MFVRLVAYSTRQLPLLNWSSSLGNVAKRHIGDNARLGITTKPHKTWKDWRALGPKANIILMGSPGSGKTTTGRILAQQMGLPYIDVDDDHLEPYWGKSVSEKLKEVGDERFVEEEGRALMTLEAEGCIISTTGSNPLHPKSMSKLAQSGLVVFLDMSKDSILKRLNMMKVNRIVGQKSGASMSDILEYRQDFYERWYDLRIICEDGETQESVAQKIVKAVNDFSNEEGFVSSRGGADDIPRDYVSFLDAVLKGLAPDGGLYLKAKNRPKFTLGELKRLVDHDFRRRALKVLERWIHPLDLSPQEIQKCLNKSFSHSTFSCPEVAPVKRLIDNHFILELFHGPTASFKDVALQIMPHFFVKAMQSSNDASKYLILVATSGDTGGAVLDGFRRHSGDARVGVMVFYPCHGISQIQRHQMTTMEGPNIKVIGVDSDFDFCQSTIKQIFGDLDLAEWMKNELDCRLSAANSINWGRLLPQVVYHVSGYLEMVRTGQIPFGQVVDLCVPTGNFGNILSAYYAKEMGLPVRHLICASNTNHVLTDFIKNGAYVLTGRSLYRTASPSIDILQSSNLERLIFHLSGENPKTVRHFYSTLQKEGVAPAPKEVWEGIQQHFVAGYATEADSVGRFVACTVGDPNMPTVISGTAHYAKFVDKILPFFYGNLQDYNNISVDKLFEQAQTLTRRPTMHQKLEAMVNKQVVHYDQVPADYESITKTVVDFAMQL
ncbi:hypothetical protein C0Q70_15127 [Pomacea canaliculata]|uniref:Threonine synthase N-terminal domain-containing protein n=1 Tax=Pomacea canaliculata TaxID=400727 RepID=A0A2T7NU10_POMCA|nr:hypothetical protein C0Q70_15127 [Pomacea canaliculata]